ncbi:CLUMA_CG016148, isoform A [Clunio marinus]|uniref:CLUMA_CG016148, isoform A n=1 Tax=Clunio marinus TaxID=568069 RepID=A0A1J1IW48_9DIPT|nr:CLUMA_CG016148, isoform A [Clunio marinus]
MSSDGSNHSFPRDHFSNGRVISSYGHDHSSNGRDLPSNGRDHSSNGRDHSSNGRDRYADGRGRRGGGHSNGRSDSKRPRDESESGPSHRPDKVQRNGNQRGGGRGGRGGKRREEFFNQAETRPKNLESKSGEAEGQKKVLVKANYFRVRKTGNFNVTSYRVDFDPVIEIPFVRNSLIRAVREQIGNYIYDGANQIYLTKPFQQKEVQFESTSAEGQTNTITIRSPRDIRFTESEFLQVMNLVMKSAMRGLNLQLVGKNLYDAAAATTIHNLKLQIWPGYTTSIRQHEQDLLLNCDINHKYMKQRTAYDIINENKRDRDVATKEIIGSTVLTDYNNKTYKISDIDWTQNPSSTFERRDGPCTYIDYYRQTYNKNIRDPRQPLLIVKNNKRAIRIGQPELISLIPELCRITGLTDRERTNFHMMKEIAQVTRLSARQKVDRLETFNKRLQQTPPSIEAFQRNDLVLDRQLVELEGRQLAGEIIHLGRGAEFNLNQGRDISDFTNALQNGNHMYKCMKLTQWYFVYPQRSQNSARDFLNVMRRSAIDMGMEISSPTEVQLPRDDNRTYAAELRKILSNDPRFIMVVMDNKRDDCYRTIKTSTYLQNKLVPSQVVTRKTLDHKNKRSIATKVAIQINCKLGGIPWKVDLRLKGLMIVGFDISETKGRHSYGAMVASLDANNDGGQYFSAVNEHNNANQLSTDFGNNFMAALKQYMNDNGALPKRILIYRDGVGDGQIQHVLDQEVNDIMGKVTNVYSQVQGSGEPKVGFVIINKRTKTRFFKPSPRNPKDFENPGAGFVVDNVVTLPERYDFYLISQKVTQGTVSPTYYNIVHDGFYPGRPQVMQQLTFKLCHLYYNWSGTTKIPSVVQYAKKLAFLVSQSLQGSPIVDNSSQQLYFL